MSTLYFISEKSGPRRVKAQAIAALSIGGMVVAQSMADESLADDLRGACKAMALKLGGWERYGKAKNVKPIRKRRHRRPSA